MPRRTRRRAELIDELTTAFRRYQRSSDALDEVAAGIIGVNRTDARVLDLVQERGRLMAGEIAVGAALTSGAVTGVVDRLERAGYVRRVADPDDRRRVLVEATDKLEEAVGATYAGIQPKGRRVTDTYSDDELELIARFVREVTAVTEEHAAELRARAT